MKKNHQMLPNARARGVESGSSTPTDIPGKAVIGYSTAKVKPLNLAHDFNHGNKAGNKSTVSTV